MHFGTLRNMHTHTRAHMSVSICEHSMRACVHVCVCLKVIWPRSKSHKIEPMLYWNVKEIEDSRREGFMVEGAYT